MVAFDLFACCFILTTMGPTCCQDRIMMLARAAPVDVEPGREKLAKQVEAESAEVGFQLMNGTERCQLQ